MTNKVAIYIRVSTVHQIDKDSLLVQRRELSAYAEYVLNIKGYEVFEDAGFSAKNTDRPQFQAMMERIRKGEFSHLLVWKIDRISRNLLDFSSMYAELKKCGVAFVSKNEQFDTSTAVGEAMLKIILVFAELERKMTSERVSAVMLSRANNGQWNGGRVPYGYNWDGTSFSFNRDEAANVQRIFDLYERTRSTLATAKRMNDLGITSRSGTDWSATTIYKVLTNVFYIGQYRYNVHNEGDGFDLRDKSEWLTIENHHDPIINLPQFTRVQKMLADNNKTSRRFRTYKNVHIFAGLLICGYCGSNMSATPGKTHRDGSNPSTYGCSKRRTGTCPNRFITDNALAPFVFSVIQILLTTKELPLKSIERRFRTSLHVSVTGLESFQSDESDLFFMPKEDVPERDILLNKKHNIEASLSRLRNLYLHNDTMQEADFAKEQQALMDSLQSVDQRLANVISSEEELNTRATYFVLLDKLSKGQFDYITIAPYAEKYPLQAFLRSCISNITIKDGFVTSICFKNQKTLFFASNQKTPFSPPSGQS